MISYKSISTHDILGRGRVYVVENEKDRTKENDLPGKTVSIDDRLFIVKGVEFFNLREGSRIGLLVKEIERGAGDDYPIIDLNK